MPLIFIWIPARGPPCTWSSMYLATEPGKAPDYPSLWTRIHPALPKYCLLEMGIWKEDQEFSSQRAGTRSLHVGGPEFDPRLCMVPIVPLGIVLGTITIVRRSLVATSPHWTQTLNSLIWLAECCWECAPRLWALFGRSKTNKQTRNWKQVADDFLVRG